MTRCVECGQAALDEQAPGGVLLVVREGALEAAAAAQTRDVVLQAPHTSADLLVGERPLTLPVGSRLCIGPFTLVVESRVQPALPLQRSRDLREPDLFEVLQVDVAAARGALPDDAADHAAVIADVVATARQVVADGLAFVPQGYRPRLAVLTLIEGIDDELVGEGRTVRVPRWATHTPAAMVGLGTMVVLSVQLSTGPGSILLTHDGFSHVAPVRCRRFTASKRGVEWRYTDLMHTDGYDMSMPRMVAGLPDIGGDALAAAWQARVLDMLQPQDW